MDEGKIICRCFAVTDKHIERVARENKLRTIEEVTNYTKAGGACKSCHMAIQDILDRIWQEGEGAGGVAGTEGQGS
ncbi:MAG: (2Fe-2S)-binding protein, partial [bacterium]|nr:(2Fe-2S)-binding protein [bacterium]